MAFVGGGLETGYRIPRVRRKRGTVWFTRRTSRDELGRNQFACYADAELFTRCIDTDSGIDRAGKKIKTRDRGRRFSVRISVRLQQRFPVFSTLRKRAVETRSNPLFVGLTVCYRNVSHDLRDRPARISGTIIIRTEESSSRRFRRLPRQTTLNYHRTRPKRCSKETMFSKENLLTLSDL